MYNKKVLRDALNRLDSAKPRAQQKDRVINDKLLPFISTEGYKQGPPPEGMHYRIPGNVIYNPTPYDIHAVGSNGEQKFIAAGDITNHEFDDNVDYVDEYPMMQYGGSIPVIEDAGNFNEDGVWIPDHDAMAKQAKKLGARKVKTRSGSILYFDKNWNITSADDNPMMQKGGSRQPIYVSNPRDPRIQAYQDSLNLSNYSTLQANKYFGQPNPDKYNSYDQREAIARMRFDRSIYNSLANSVSDIYGNKLSNLQKRTGYLPIGQRYLGEGSNYIFKKPVQPVYYKELETPPVSLAFVPPTITDLEFEPPIEPETQWTNPNPEMDVEQREPEPKTYIPEFARRYKLDPKSFSNLWGLKPRYGHWVDVPVEAYGGDISIPKLTKAQKGKTQKYDLKTQENRYQKLYVPIIKKITDSDLIMNNWETYPNYNTGWMEYILNGPSGDRNIPYLTPVLKEMQSRMLSMPNTEIDKLLKVNWSGAGLPTVLYNKPSSVSLKDMYKYYNHLKYLKNQGYTLEEGGDISIPQLNQYEDGGDYIDIEATDAEIDELRKGGYIVKEHPSLPKKKGSKAYSKSLMATNQLFAQNPLTKKAKSKKNKIFDPNAKYYQVGGERDTIWNQNLAKDDKEFQDWYWNNSQALEAGSGIPYSEDFAYDYYSYFKNKDHLDTQGNPTDHYIDKYKRPQHPVFSDQSLYSTPENPGGHWETINGEEVLIPHQGLSLTKRNKKLGGFQDDINRRRKLLRDWTYGASIGTLHEAEYGIEMDLTPEEIEQYKKGGYIVEEY